MPDAKALLTKRLLLALLALKWMVRLYFDSPINHLHGNSQNYE
jgi:hypothetical protein